MTLGIVGCRQLGAARLDGPPGRTLFRSLSTVTLALGQSGRRRRPPAARARSATALVASDIAVRPVSLKSISRSLMTRPKSILPSARLADREVGCRTARRGLPFGARELCTNKRPMHRPIFQRLIRFLAARA